MQPDLRLTKKPDGSAADLHGSKWTDTFVTHSRHRLIHRVRYYVYERAFFRHITDRNARILDVGCGSGEFMALLLQRGFTNLHGVEIDDTLIDMASGIQADIKKSSATALPFDDNSFDCIYMFNVMHHLKGMTEYEQSLAEMSRCLRDGGRIIMVEPCRLSLYQALKTVSYAGRHFSRFFSNFYLILQEEWVDLTCFLRNLDTLRQRISGSGEYVVLQDCKLLHQWLTVLAVHKGNGSVHGNQAGCP